MPSIDQTRTYEQDSPAAEIREKRLAALTEKIRDNYDSLGPYSPIVEHLYQYDSPITDSRLKELHKWESEPVQLHPFGSFETTSWKLTESSEAQEQWTVFFDRFISILETINPQQWTEELDSLAAEISGQLEEAIMQYGESVARISPIPLTPENIITAGSGADVIHFFRKSMGCDDANNPIVATTSENGSGVTNPVESMQEHGFVIPTRSMNEIPYSDEYMLSMWNQVLEEAQNYPDRPVFLSLTAMSKTGLPYYQEGGVVDQVLARVQQLNEHVRSENPIIVVVDCVQLAGRIPFEKIARWLSHPAAQAVVHTGSKVAGGTPHYGFGLLSEAGKKTIEQNLQRARAVDEIDQWQKWIDDHQCSYAPLLTQASENSDIDYRLTTQQNQLAHLRGIQNADRFRELLDTPEDQQLYSERGKKLVALIHHLFRLAGFRSLDNNPESSVCTFLPPEDLSPQIVKNVLLPTLQNLGVALGGYVQEAGLKPILRAGLPLPWLKDTNSNILRGLFGENLEYFLTTPPDQIDYAQLDPGSVLDLLLEGVKIARESQQEQQRN